MSSLKRGQAMRSKGLTPCGGLLQGGIPGDCGRSATRIRAGSHADEEVVHFGCFDRFAFFCVNAS